MKVLSPSLPEGPARSSPEVPAIRRALLEWHARHRRALRFRLTTDAWLVLVSEVMAQQTQVGRVEIAWASFIRLFPTPAACAAAPLADVLRAWSGLGYNRRAVSLHRAAQAIVADHGGRVPSDLADLESLPGVGPYTARAVAAIAFGRPVAAVDTNIRRLVGRLLGKPDASPRALQADADALVDPTDPAAWTHAAMDLGASVCISRVPRCGVCPLGAWCTTAAARETLDGPPMPPRGRRARPAAPIPFGSTSRWLRGRIVERLRDIELGAWARVPDAVGSHDAASVASAVDALVRDGLVERRPDGTVRLPGGTS
jgi:A/G-specific adenine glycosylase